MNNPAGDYGDLDEMRIFQALEDHQVEYVLVGGSAAIAPRSPQSPSFESPSPHSTTSSHQRRAATVRRTAKHCRNSTNFDSVCKEETATDSYGKAAYACADDGLVAIGLPNAYPHDDNGGLIPHDVCQPVGQETFDAGLDGVDCRSP